MRLLFFLLSVILVKAGVIKEECDGVKINDIYYEKEVLRTDVDRPYLLAVDYSTNTLYYSFNIDFNDDVSYKSAFLNLNTKESGEVTGVTNGFAHTVDQKTHEVYIGGSDGIYKYDHKSKKAELFGANGSDVWGIYYKEILYYLDFPRQFLYTYIDGVSTRFKDLEDTKVDQFVIDNEDILFYTNATGLFGQKKGTKDAVLFKNNMSVRSLTTDINGNVYLCELDDVYKVNKETRGIDKVTEVNDCFGLAFDNENNLIYSNATSLVRLKPNVNKGC
ncbi:ommochrome-binding protein [Pieris rapae]|uniref:ommochrome-binding protein n=1 Tax=Pieris rapae TaxID=64459 RepID=UPI001E2818AE|nr:ommochrome-binding protein [Pieris rapae]